MEKVKIKAMTETFDPVDGEYDKLTPGEFLAYCARVSNPANQNNNLTAPKLLKYLVKNKHWSPFEMVSITMEINTTRDIGRQILRHRSFSFQEFSQRYADVSALGEMFVDPRETRLQDTKNRQNSLETDDEKLQIAWRAYQGLVIQNAKDSYTWALEHGIAKEQARVVLPEGLTKTRMYMAGTLRSWIHYCQLRMSNGTQKEHREIAIACWEAITEAIPELKEVLGEEQE